MLDQHPELRLLPDTAHLAVAGDNFLDLIPRVHSKIVAVHLKDWTPVYGRFSHRCARGFVELGAGVVKLEAILDELDRVAFNGWVVVEQNSKHIRPEATVFHCSQWLANRGHLPKAPEWTEKTNLATPPENHSDGNRAHQSRVQRQRVEPIRRGDTVGRVTSPRQAACHPPGPHPAQRQSSLLLHRRRPHRRPVS